MKDQMYVVFINDNIVFKAPFSECLKKYSHIKGAIMRAAK
jgi:hypothetical protein